MKSLGHEVVMISHEGRTGLDDPQRDSTFLEFDRLSGVALLKSDPEDFEATKKELKQVIKDYKIDVIHGHTCCGGATCATAAKEAKILGVESFHSVCGGSSPADVVISMSETARQGWKHPNLHVVRPPLRTGLLKRYRDPVEHRASLGIPQDARVVGRFCRVTGSKDPYSLVDIVSLLPSNYWGLLVGDGDELERVKEYARSRGVANRFTFPGMQRMKGDFYALMDYMAFKSIDENSPVTLLEAMFCNVPVLAVPCGAVSELVEHTVTGYLPRDVYELAHFIKQLEFSLPLYNSTLDAAYDYVTREHDPMTQTKKLEALYVRGV
jgi:glycosyltransferase involved in cell wall biosynthesis